MRFEQPLVEGTLLRRERLFVADVQLEGGEQVQAHCANPGSLRGCAEPGSKVLISVHDNPHSKFKHHLEIVYLGKTPIAVHTARHPIVVSEAIAQAKIPELAGYASLHRERGASRGMKLDLRVEGNGLRPCFMKVENVTMTEEGVGLYPDIRVEDGPKMMQDLTNLVREGNRAMLVFLAPRSDIKQLRPADRIDPEYTQALRDAIARGVEAVCYRAKVTRKGIELDERLPIDLSEN